MIAVEMGGDEGCSSKGSTRAIGDEDEGLRKEKHFFKKKKKKKLKITIRIANNLAELFKDVLRHVKLKPMCVSHCYIKTRKKISGQ